MAYERLHWVESETPLSAENMNNIEDGIEELQSQKVDKVSGKGLSDQNYTAAEKTKLAGIEAGAQANPGEATTGAAGLMSAADKTKLNGIATGAEVNQNAFSNVMVRGDDTTTIAASSKTDTLNVSFANHIRIIPVASNKSVQIMTDIEDASSTTKGLMSASDKIKLDGIVGETSYTLGLSRSATFNSGSFGTLDFYLGGPQGGSNLVVKGIEEIRIRDSSGNSKPLCICGFEKVLYGSPSTVGIRVRLYNPTSSSVVVSEATSLVRAWIG